jgi:phospholipid-binding lipoprotein MlaA
MANFADVQTDYIGNIDHIPTRNQLRLTRIIHGRAALFAAEELITGDRYSFIRDAYLQRREYLVNDGVVEDTFGDENSAEEWDEGEWEE